MNTRTKTVGAISSAVLAAGLGYAAAQQAPAKPQTAPPQGQSTTTNNACAENCGCMMRGGMMGGGQSGMMHGQNGMMGGGQSGMVHGQNGMMDGQNGMGMACAGGDCCSMTAMGGMADIKVENTKRGAVVHMNARKADQIGQLQQMAQQMMHCLGNGQPDTAPAAPATPKPAR